MALENLLVPHQDDSGTQHACRGDGAFHRHLRPAIPTHGIEGNPDRAARRHLRQL
jgi:hypothetical protein